MEGFLGEWVARGNSWLLLRTFWNLTGEQLVAAAAAAAARARPLAQLRDGARNGRPTWPGAAMALEMAARGFPIGFRGLTWLLAA